MADNHKVEFTPGEALVLRVVLNRYIDEMIVEGKEDYLVTKTAERAYDKLCAEREAMHDAGRL
jgi:hypothetical protein